MAQTSGRALLTLIDDILDLSKIEARKITLENLSFNLRDTVEDVVQLLRVQAGAKGLDFASRVSPEIPSLLRGDAHRLRQVLTNLCSNAIKFTERGGVTLEAALEGQADGAATVRFSRHRYGNRDTAGPGSGRCSLHSSRRTPPPRASTAAPGSGWRSASSLSR